MPATASAALRASEVRGPVAAIAVAVIVVVSAADAVAPAPVEFSPLYLLPVLLVVLISGRRLGYPAAFAAIALWLTVAIATGELGGSWVTVAWNAAMRAAIFVVTVHLLARAIEGRRALEQLASRDPLTDLANWRHLHDRAEAEIARAERQGEPLSAIYIDIDDFKLVNDNFGHEAGDEILRVTARTLDDEARTMDLAARVGGDEFVLLLPATSELEVRVVADRVKRALTQSVREAGWPVSYSLGAVSFAEPPDGVEQLLMSADEQMYRAKRRAKRRGLQRGA